MNRALGQRAWMKIVCHSLSGFNARHGRGFSESVVPGWNSLLDDPIPALATDALILAQVAPIAAPFRAVDALLCAYEVHAFLRADRVSLAAGGSSARQASPMHVASVLLSFIGIT